MEWCGNNHRNSKVTKTNEMVVEEQNQFEQSPFGGIQAKQCTSGFTKVF